MTTPDITSLNTLVVNQPCLPLSNKRRDSVYNYFYKFVCTYIYLLLCTYIYKNNCKLCAIRTNTAF